MVLELEQIWVMAVVAFPERALDLVGRGKDATVVGKDVKTQRAVERVAAVEQHQRIAGLAQELVGVLHQRTKVALSAAVLAGGDVVDKGVADPASSVAHSQL